MYTKAHAAIRADPDPEAPKAKGKTDEAKKTGDDKKKRWNKPKQTLAARRNKIVQKKLAVIAKLDAEVNA